MQTSENLVRGMTAIRHAVRVGVKYQLVKFGDELPSELHKPFSILHIDDAGNAGPAAFGVDALLKQAGAIYLWEEGTPVFDALTIAKIALECPLVLISCGATFRFWFHHVETLGLLPKTMARAVTNPRSKAQ
jgi:hypothetical protein